MKPENLQASIKGFAIMLVLMMLFLLFMLGVAFFFSAWTHAFMARNYLNMKRAFVVAEGGVHHAIGAIIGDFTWTSHAQNKHVDFRWRYGDDPTTPVEYALNPSYAMGKTLRILGKEVGLSGVMDPGGGAYGINSDIYHLKVNECSAQLYVNEGLGHPYNTAVMQRVLNNLGVQLRPEIKGLGDLIMQARPPRGYESKAELKEALDKIDPKIYPRVKDLLCVHTWSDPKVCNPVPLSEKVIRAYHQELLETRPIDSRTGKRITRYDRGRKLIWYEGGTAVDANLVYSYDELNPCWIDITSRAPVNINTAPRQILVALLMDLEGFFVLPQLRTAGLLIDVGYHKGYSFYYPSAGTIFPGELGVIFRTARVDQTMAEAIAEHIITAREKSPFRSWTQFNGFVDNLVDRGIIAETKHSASYFNFLRLEPDIYDYFTYKLQVWDRYRYYASKALGDAIKANFNPNLHLNELNPNFAIWQLVDKTDLIKNSTEFCFLPTGYFEIESVGQILRAEWEDGKFHISPYLLIMKDSFEHNNQIMGQRRLRVEVKLWDLYRETAQRDFYQGSFSPNTAPYATNGNWGCETGPELQNGYGPFENEFEGYVTLSTVGGSLPLDQQRTKGRLYMTERSEWDRSPYKTMHAHYDFDFSLHHDMANRIKPLPTGYIDPGEPASGPYTPGYAPERYRVCRGYRYVPNIKLPMIAPSDHRVDGFYGERFSLLPYYSKGGNFPGWQGEWKYQVFIGTYSYWVKPIFLPELSSYRRVFSYIRDTSRKKYIIQHDYSWAHHLGRGLFRGLGPFKEQDVVGFWQGGIHVPYSMAAIFGPRGMWASETSPTLHHISHAKVGYPGRCILKDPSLPQFSWFRGHRWIAVDVSWYINFRCYSYFSKYASINFELQINGRRLPGTQVYDYLRELRRNWSEFWTPFRPPFSEASKFWLGGDPEINATSNATFDEFSVWASFVRKVRVPPPKPKCGTSWARCLRPRGRRCESSYPYYCRMDCRCPKPTCPTCKVQGCYRHKWGRCPATTVCRCGYTRRCNGEGACNLFWCSPGRFSWRCPNRTRWYRCACPPLVCSDCGIRGCRRYYPTRNCPNRVPGQVCLCSSYPRAKCGQTGRSAGSCGSVYPYCRPCRLKCDCGPKPPWTDVLDPELEAKSLWRHGRYYRENDAEFVSQEIDLAKTTVRGLPAPNAVVDPYGGKRDDYPADPGLREQIARQWRDSVGSSVKILGMAWTVVGDVRDYKPTEGGERPDDLRAQLEVSLYMGQRLIAGPFLNHDSGWAPLLMKPGGKVRYSVRFNTRCDPENAILLETPILDDLTIYYTTRPQWISWVESY